MYVKRPEILLLSIEVVIFTLQFYRCIYEALIYYHEHLIHNSSSPHNMYCDIIKTANT